MFDTTRLWNFPPLSVPTARTCPGFTRCVDRSTVVRRAFRSMACLMPKMTALRASRSSSGPVRFASIEYSPRRSTSSSRPGLENTRKGCRSFVAPTRRSRVSTCGAVSPMDFAVRRKRCRL